MRIEEMRCATERQARVFNGRNKHGVPLEAGLAMWRRFERDDRATVVDAGASGTSMAHEVVGGGVPDMVREQRAEAALARLAMAGRGEAGKLLSSSPSPALPTTNPVKRNQARQITCAEEAEMRYWLSSMRRN